MKKIIDPILCLLIVLIWPCSVSALTADSLPDPHSIHSQDGDWSLDQLLDQLPSKAQISDPFLILVNPSHPASDELANDLVHTTNGIPIAASVFDPLEQFIGAAQEAGFELAIISGYRTSNQQAYLESSRRNSLLASGYSQTEAERLTSLYTAPANATEHLTGFAVDMLGSDWTQFNTNLLPEYGDYPSAQWLAANAATYGFILRYLPDKTDLTSFNYEPWHFRYVGIDHAQYISKHGLVLEEYLSLLMERDRRIGAEKVRQAAEKQSLKEVKAWLDQQSRTVDSLFETSE